MRKDITELLASSLENTTSTSHHNMRYLKYVLRDGLGVLLGRLTEVDGREVQSEGLHKDEHVLKNAPRLRLAVVEQRRVDHLQIALEL